MNRVSTALRTAELELKEARLICLINASQPIICRVAHPKMGEEPGDLSGLLPYVERSGFRLFRCYLESAGETIALSRKYQKLDR